jgi:hypothetical protein
MSYLCGITTWPRRNKHEVLLPLVGSGVPKSGRCGVQDLRGSLRMPLHEVVRVAGGYVDGGCGDS